MTSPKDISRSLLPLKTSGPVRLPSAQTHTHTHTATPPGALVSFIHGDSDYCRASTASKAPTQTQEIAKFPSEQPRCTLKGMPAHPKKRFSPRRALTFLWSCPSGNSQSPPYQKLNSGVTVVSLHCCFFIPLAPKPPRKTTLQYASCPCPQRPSPFHCPVVDPQKRSQKLHQPAQMPHLKMAVRRNHF